MKNLQQEKYKDDNGRDIDALHIEALAPYQYHVDGFYQWICSKCDFVHNSRSCGWPISGQVLACDQCHAMNLLVRTNCVEIDEVLQGKWRSEERDKENERLKGIEKYNEDELRKIRFKLLDVVRQSLDSTKVIP